MSTNENYRERIKAELDSAQVRLAELKAAAATKLAEGKVEYADQIAALEKHVETGRAKLVELGGASGEAWGVLKVGAGQAWGSLSTAVKEAAGKFKS